MEVLRTKAVDRNAEIKNIFIDDENVKWILNTNGLQQVLSADYGTNEEVVGLQRVLGAYVGNKVISEWPLKEITEAMGNLKFTDITAGFYEVQKNILWIGTANGGILKFKTDNGIRLDQRIDSGNSKLKSNQINTIFVDAFGRRWFGTNEGLLKNAGGKWELIEKDFEILSVTTYGREVCFLADEWLWISSTGKSFDAIDLPDQVTEREIKDVAFDSQGRIWIASAIISRYDREADTYELYGGPENFTSEFVSCIAVDKEDALWIGTEDKGLYMIDKKSAMSVVAKLEQPLSCGGEKNDAAIKVIVSGGKPPYTYAWSNSLEGPEPKNLGAGEYAVTVTDSKGKAKAAKTVIPSATIVGQVKQEKQERGAGAKDGVAVVAASGGAGSYTYQWDNGETTARAEKLGEGEHSVVVTDKNNCSVTATVMISQQVGELALSFDRVNKIACADDETGTLAIKVEGGKRPYTYSWSNGGTGASIDKIASGSYAVTVQDASGQQSSATYEMEAPPAMEVNVEVDKAASVNATDGKATVKVKNGRGKLTYLWDNQVTTATNEQLGPGNHSVTVTDQAGCITVASTDISENVIEVTLKLEVLQNVNCDGEQNGIIRANVANGKPPFTYNWSHADVATPKVEGLAPGEYSVSVTDATGFKIDGTIEIKKPDPLTINASVDASATANGSDGKASVKAKGGSGGYNYKWSNANTDKSVDNLPAGTHGVTVTDKNGCTLASEVVITEDILPLSVILDQIAEINCFGESTASVRTVVKGGKSPFTFQWSNEAGTNGEARNLSAGTYDLTVTDVEGTTSASKIDIKQPIQLSVTAKVDASATTDNADGKATVKVEGGTGNYTYRWANGETTAQAVKLAPGKQGVTITDEAGCTVKSEVTISENILPLAVNLEVVKENNCYGEAQGALAVKVEGGKKPFVYKWDNASLQDDKVNGLKGGQYKLTVTDATGLTAEASAKLSIPEQLQATVDRTNGVTDERTKDGFASVKIEGGTGDYTIQWDNEEDGKENKKLSMGSHGVTVADANGCQANLTFTIDKKIIPQLNFDKMRTGQTIRLDELYFEADSSRLTAEKVPVLDELADFLDTYPGVVVEIGGHTNNIPAHEFCDRLSTARAQNVSSYLVKQGIEAKRVVYKGYGKRKPLMSNKTAEGRERNQRVEIKILSLGTG